MSSNPFAWVFALTLPFFCGCEGVMLEHDGDGTSTLPRLGHGYDADVDADFGADADADADFDSETDVGADVDADSTDHETSICDGRIHPAMAINELLSANVHGVLDADGDTSDWIELINLDSEAVSLAGWGLSDDLDEPQRWTLPDVTLVPGGVLLVFASGKDRRGSELHASFALSSRGEDVLLSAPDDCPVDQVDAVRLYGDISFGRTVNHPDIWEFFLEPTPGAPNEAESRPGFAATPTSGTAHDLAGVGVLCRARGRRGHQR